MKSNKKTCLKPYIDINTELRKEAKKDFEKDFFKLINNAKTWKMLENTESLNLQQQKKKKKLFSFRTKLSNNKIFFKYF